jgi:hypothetical protein
MRLDGRTLQEIADHEGISKQAVYEKLETYKRKMAGARGHGFNINTIVYNGIYEHFAKNQHETVSSFAEKVYGTARGGHSATVRSFNQGERQSRFTIDQIKKICDIVGKSFEETFELREVTS